MSSFSAGVITVSDSVHAGVNEDKSGAVIQDLLRDHGWHNIRSAVVPDNEESIQGSVRQFCNLELDWVITTGGTGFGERDRTPEAISPIIERPASGLVHLLLSASLKHTPLAALSRPVAGTVGRTLVVTLPGSVKAVRENMETLLSNGLVDHALDLIRGGDGKAVHLAMGTAHTPVAGDCRPRSPAGHNGHRAHVHSHGHHQHDHIEPRPRAVLSHDPSAAASGRHRVSPYPQISLAEALDLVINTIQPIGIVTLPVTPALAGHVLAESVYATQDVPASKTTNVDGYALRSSDPSGVYDILTSQTHKLSDELPVGSIFRINTGGPLPVGPDAVIMVEDTELVSTFKDANGTDVEEKQVKTLAQVSPNENVRQPGSDVRQGELVLPQGEAITSLGGEIGTLAFVGRKEVSVWRKPVVALLSTGNELLDLQSPQSIPSDGWGGIWDTNRPSLQATLEGMGYSVVDLGIIADNVDAHVEAICRGLNSADILLATGGTSMGASDLLKPVIERKFGGTIYFGRVSMKPGKPTTFASLPAEAAAQGRKFLFALPGNPASALVTLHVFVVPALRRLGGWPADRCQLPRVRVQLQNAMPLDPRVEFHRVVVRSTPRGLQASSTGGQRSSRVASLSGANGLVQLPVLKEDGPRRLEAGEFAQVVMIGEIRM